MKSNTVYKCSDCLKASKPTGTPIPHMDISNYIFCDFFNTNIVKTMFCPHYLQWIQK